MQIHVAGLSDRGRVRAQNDDHYCLGPFVEQDTLTALSFDMASCQMRTYGLLTAVADGMGGYAGGGIASRLTLEILSAFYYGEARTGASAADLQAQLARYLAQTAQMLSAHLTRTPEIADAGTTLTGLALLAPHHLVLFHLGDTRALRYSAGYLRQLTIDHTPYGADLAAGRLTEEEAARPDLAGLQRSLGRDASTAFAYECEMTCAPGDTFLLGSDGWHGLGRGLSREELKTLLTATPDPRAFVRHSVRQAIAQDGQDNATAVAIRCVNEESCED